MVNKLIINKLLAVDYTLTGPGISPTKEGNATATLEKIISQFIGILSIVAFIWFVIQIILAGYAILSAGGDEKKLESARNRLTNGVLGLTIVVVAYGLGALLAFLLGIQNIFDLNGLLDSMGLKQQ